MKWLNLFRRKPVTAYEKAIKLAKKHSLQPRKCYVIVGPKGSGKSVLANELAKKYGGITQTANWADLLKPFGWGEALLMPPSVLIIDEVSNVERAGGGWGYRFSVYENARGNHPTRAITLTLAA